MWVHFNTGYKHCSEELDTEIFHNLATETAGVYVEYYSWYYMPHLIHKILIHGARIIASFVIPIV